MSSHDLPALGWNPRLEAAYAALGRTELIAARVAAVHRGRLELLSATGALAGAPSGRMIHGAATAADLPAVGDWVAADPESGVVHALLPRQGGLARAAGHGRGEPQVLAANVDLALVVGSLNRDLNVRRLERFLTVAADAEADALVVLSKADLSGDPAGRALDVRAALGGTVPVLAVSVVDGSGIATLEAWLAPGRTAVLLGSSGVGKTTLLNHLSGDRRRTLPVRTGDDRGRHATTHRELVPLASGALVIDTPGLRLPRVWEQAGGLRSVFADVDELALRCRFRDCSHRDEPGCAVAAAIADGRLSAGRLAGMEKLAREEAWVASRRDERARSERKRSAKRLQRELRRTYRARGRD
ncbi:MAG TPA: ribosome small subunit-dependent GTPase A [Solirubrobacteraceae bacterium]|nr:ribosome small subunit-dependent GTPase A [Solirubrobacteraceae bacterium]